MAGKILVVDDDATNRELLQESLIAEGLEVVTAPDGRSSLEEFARLKPDLVLLDVNMPFFVTDVLMPGSGGLQTLFVLKNTPETSEIPAIVVSGINPRILGLMPAAAYLQKPVERLQFVQTVRNCLNGALHKSI